MPFPPLSFVLWLRLHCGDNQNVAECNENEYRADYIDGGKKSFISSKNGLLPSKSKKCVLVCTYLYVYVCIYVCIYVCMCIIAAQTQSMTKHIDHT